MSQRVVVEGEYPHGTPVEDILAQDARHQELLARGKSTPVRTWRNLLYAAKRATWL